MPENENRSLEFYNNLPVDHNCPPAPPPRPQNPIKEALEKIVDLRSQPLNDLTREQMRMALRAFSAQLESDQADIPGDILEALGPEDRRAALLAFCNLVAVGTFGQPRQKPKPPPPLIIIPGRKL